MERTGLVRRTTSPAIEVVSLERFRALAPGRFFVGAVSPATPAVLAQYLTEARDQGIAHAEELCRGRFDLLGYRRLTFGDPVDWHLDPISGRRAPRVHWSRLDPLDHSVVGDHKITWELNRHQWLIQLGQAYQFTANERYADAFVSYVRQWMRANPRGIGINWASSLEVSLRLIAWCWALCLFRESKALSAELFKDMVGWIAAHASHVERYLSHYFSPNTHLTGEALGLVYAGIVLPELPRAARWRARGARILIEQSERQILPDGVYFEQSTCYQRYTVEIYLHFIILARRNGLEVPGSVVERVQRLLDFLLAIRHPDTSMPMIGDADGGWLMPLAQRAPDDFRGIFSTAAALFARSDYGWAAGGAMPEALWLLGAPQAKAFETLAPSQPPIGTSQLFAEGGYAVMRSGWGTDAHQLIFDVGPLGCPISGGHGHADLLSIQCCAFGEPYLVDAGTYCYTADRRWRDFFRSAEAHSTVRVDGTEPARPAGPFAWHRLPRARLHRWLSNDAVDIADAEHEAYRSLHDPVVHRRRVLFVKRGYWIVIDDLEGSADHGVELRFQFAPMDVTVDSGFWARAHGRRGHDLLIRPFATAPLKAEVREAEVDPIQGWISLNYGERRPAPTLIYSTVTPLPISIATLIWPTAAPLAVPPKVDVRPPQGDDSVEVVLDDRTETICLRAGKVKTTWHRGGTE